MDYQFDLILKTFRAQLIELASESFTFYFWLFLKGCIPETFFPFSVMLLTPYIKLCIHMYITISAYCAKIHRSILNISQKLSYVPSGTISPLLMASQIEAFTGQHFVLLHWSILMDQCCAWDNIQKHRCREKGDAHNYLKYL